MTIILCAIHSQYIHSALAPWYLKAAAEAWCRSAPEVRVLEGTINQPEEELLRLLLERPADVLAFSCYIWNWAVIRRLLPRVAERAPETRILLGGPEASFRAAEILRDFPMVTAVQVGEGERGFARILDRLAAGEALTGIPGVYSRAANGEIEACPAEGITEDPPSPYGPAYLAALRGRIAYLETSRGCPFSYAFCLSGRHEGVRFFELNRAKRELLLLAGAGTKTVKLVDRTFNCQAERAFDLFRFLIEQAKNAAIPGGVCFHFEVGADLFDDRTLDLLATAPAGLFQMEAGLQSFHEPTLRAVSRKTDLDKLCRNLKRLLRPGNIHVHIDLIAGLPYEDLETFAGSFNRAYGLRPHMLQLGFLKLLHGSRLRRQAEELGLDYRKDPPYTFLRSRWLDEADTARLSRLEDVLERLHNSGRFRLTLAYALRAAETTPFALLDTLADGLIQRGIRPEGMSLDAYTAAIFEELAALPGIDRGRLRDVMVCDRLAAVRGGLLPPCLQVTDKALGRLKRRLAEAEPSGGQRGAAILYSFGGRAVVVRYDAPDPVTNRYALRPVPPVLLEAPADGRDEAAANLPG